MKRRISWRTTALEDAMIARIVERAVRELPSSALQIWGPAGRRELTMDLVATHANDCRLRLADLLAADDFNFAHDVFGIRQTIDRKTAKLTRGFWPRCARPLEEPHAIPRARRVRAR